LLKNGPNDINEEGFFNERSEMDTLTPMDTFE
jgi:hypothetical protein